MTNAITYLVENNIPHRVFQHHTRPTSLEQAAAERGEMPHQVIRSILFRLAEDRYVMVLMPGPGQISWKKLRTYLGTRRITMATPDEVMQISGYKIGAVSPFGLPSPLRIIVDKCITVLDEISLGSGKHGLAIIMSARNMLAGLQNYEIADLSEDSS